MKRRFAISLFIMAFVSTKAQVNLQRGSLDYSVPVYSFSDNLSKLSLNVALNYSSANGITVDEIPSDVGTGWTIGGIGIISRIQRGQPDDQMERAGTTGDNTKYPAGYLFNSSPITNGCPSSLELYPIFESSNQVYKDHNVTTADREQDYFVFNLNGRIGKFVIDKSNHVRLLSDSRLRIADPSFDAQPTNNCRTLISKFTVTDENGVVYEFAQRQYNKRFNYIRTAVAPTPESPYWISTNPYWSTYPTRVRELATTNNYMNWANDIPGDQNPFVTTNWYLTKITDPLATRSIIFEYAIRTVIMDGTLNINYTRSNMDGNVDQNQWYVGSRNNILVTREKIYEKKPVISKITFPNNDLLNFNYGDSRVDANGLNKLSDITVNIYSNPTNKVVKFGLTQSYFVKNLIKEPNPLTTENLWSRLCLLGVKKIVGSESINVASFDYYTGSDNIENFVPPIFFHAKDPWGYYNGSNCGVAIDQFMDVNNLFNYHVDYRPDHLNEYYPSPAQKLALFNTDYTSNTYLPGGFGSYTNCYMKSTCKSGYAQNGLLKSITGTLGGVMSFEYAQNKSEEYVSPYSESVFHSSQNNMSPDCVGGVHISKILRKRDMGDVNPEITEYRYVNQYNSSSLWGAEFPCNIEVKDNYYESERRYLAGSDCDYQWKYPGIDNLQAASKSNSSSDIFTLLNSFHLSNVVGQFLNDMGTDNITGAIIVSITQYIIGIINSCLLSGGAPHETATTFAHYNSALNFDNALPIQFKRVEVLSYSSSGLTAGKEVHEFTSPLDFPLLEPSNYFPYTNKQRAYDWVYGLPKATYIYDNNNKLIRSSANNYSLIENKFTSSNTLSCNCISNYTKSMRNTDWENQVGNFTTTTDVGSNPNFPAMKVEFYNQAAGRVQLQNTTETIYNSLGEQYQSTTNYSYNPGNFQPALISSTDSKGKLTEKKIYYPEDYNTSAVPVLQNLVNYNIVNSPVSTETWQTRPTGTPELLSSTVTEFGLTPNGDYKPIKTYGLQTASPIPQSTIGVFNPNTLIRNTTYIKAASEFTYDNAGNVIQAKDIEANKLAATVYGYNNLYPIALASNAQATEIAYTSFEESNNSQGGWSISSATPTTDICPTGKYCLDLSGNTVTTSIPITKPYKISFWAKGSNINVTGVTVPISLNSSNWTYYEFDLQANAVSTAITGNCKIDELRLYPKNASMVTTTYEPGVGKTSECDINNRVTYYEYDAFGRIVKIKDANRNIIKTYEYHIKN